MTKTRRNLVLDIARYLQPVFLVAISSVLSFDIAAEPLGDPAGGTHTTIAAAPTAGASGITAPHLPAKPAWNELSPAQQQALAPLSSEWDQLDAFRKGKWLAIGNKFHRMKPEEQQRVQERMRDWVALTPEQRRMARESYARSKKLNSTQKSARWEQYQQLPAQEKKKLAADATTKKSVAALPPAAAQGKRRIPPIKSAPKPVLERSVTPQAATQSALQPSPQSDR
ncbi:hypothetical protein GCM10027343_20020 [Noviherbaspirillum agri]